MLTLHHRHIVRGAAGQPLLARGVYVLPYDVAGATAVALITSSGRRVGELLVSSTVGITTLRPLLEGLLDQLDPVGATLVHMRELTQLALSRDRDGAP